MGGPACQFPEKIYTKPIPFQKQENDRMAQGLVPSFRFGPSEERLCTLKGAKRSFATRGGKPKTWRYLGERKSEIQCPRGAPELNPGTSQTHLVYFLEAAGPVGPG